MRTLSIILFLCGLFPLHAWALKVERQYEHYLIAPQSLKDFSKETRAKGPYSQTTQSRVRAMYQSSIKFLSRIRYKTVNGSCHITFNEPILKGTVVLYWLDPNYEYSQKIKDRYQQRYDKSQQHELTHETIYREGLEKAEARIRRYIQNNSGSCRPMREAIRAIYKEERANIRLANLQYDCDEYGFNNNAQRCKRLLKSDVKATEDPNQHCDGELVEAFKGKFYCVSGEYTR